MRLSAKAVAIVFAILWGASILLVGLINLAAPAYGVNFLHGLSSGYPGFHASRTVHLRLRHALLFSTFPVSKSVTSIQWRIINVRRLTIIVAL